MHAVQLTKRKRNRRQWERLSLTNALYCTVLYCTVLHRSMRLTPQLIVGKSIKFALVDRVAVVDGCRVPVH
jgi:hypothetical protein